MAQISNRDKICIKKIAQGTQHIEKCCTERGTIIKKSGKT